MERWWEVTISKWSTEFDQEVLVEIQARVKAHTAQEAMRHFVDLTTNNGRVKRIEVREFPVNDVT
jgi:hypothetical protein